MDLEGPARSREDHRAGGRPGHGQDHPGPDPCRRHLPGRSASRRTGGRAAPRRAGLLRRGRHRRHPASPPGGGRRQPLPRRLREPPRPTAVPFVLPRDIAALEQAVIEHDAALVIIDPVMSYLDPDVDSHKDQSVRSALMPLAAMCQRTGVAVLLLRHLNKDSSKSALYRGGGSIAFAALPGSCCSRPRTPTTPTPTCSRAPRGTWDAGRPPSATPSPPAPRLGRRPLGRRVRPHRRHPARARQARPEARHPRRGEALPRRPPGRRAEARRDVIDAAARVNLNAKAIERARRPSAWCRSLGAGSAHGGCRDPPDPDVRQHSLCL